MIEEIWKDIVGYEGIYKVSNLGRVKSYSRYPHGKLLSGVKSKNGYYKVILCKNKQKITISIHRLVATTFLPNPNNLPQVNHKDEDKSNNSLDNLEWCSASYNHNYGTGIERTSKGESRQVVQATINGEIIQIFSSLTEASKLIPCPLTYLSTICNGKQIYKGYRYYYRQVSKNLGY